MSGFNYFYQPPAAAAGQEYEAMMNSLDMNMHNNGTNNNNNNNNANNNNTNADPQQQQQAQQQQTQLQGQQGQPGPQVGVPFPPQFQQQLNQLQQQQQQVQMQGQQPGGPATAGVPFPPHFPQQLNQNQNQNNNNSTQQQQHPQQHNNNNNNTYGQMTTNQAQLQVQLQAQAQLQVQQQQQLHQQLQQQAQQIQQLTAASVVAVPPPLGDPTGLLGAADAAGELAEAFGGGVGGAMAGMKRNLGVAQQQDDDGDDDDSFTDGDDDDDDDDDNDDRDGPFSNRKRAKHLDKDGKLTRRQRPPKTNITRTRYSNDFKMRVVHEIEEPGYGTIADISKHYSVAEQTLRDWIKNKDKIILSVQRRGGMKANPVNHLEHVTQALLKYMDEYHETGSETPITARMIADKGQSIKRQLLQQDAQTPFLTEASRKATKKFSSSLSWGKKWVRQYAKSAKTTQVPQDLDSLSKEELMRMLRSVASEREALMAPKKDCDGVDASLGGGETDIHGEGAGAVPGMFNHKQIMPFIPAPPRIKPSAVYKIDQAKTRIAETLANMIKKKGHNWKGRPSTEVTEDVPSLENVRELFVGYPEVNKTARSYRWQLNGDQIVEWLGISKYVHPVKFDGKVVCTIGQNDNIYAFAGYDSMLAKYEQGTSTLTLKVKTFTAGTGNIPGCDEPVFLC